MTPKQRNFFIICGAVLVAWYVHGWIGDMERQAQIRHQQAIRAQQRQQAQAKPKPAAPAAKKPPLPAGAAPPPAPHAAAAATPKPPAPYAKLAGIWRGQAAIEGRGICGLRFELTPKTPDTFSGFSSFTCANIAPLMAAKNRRNQKEALLNRMDPDSAILTGTMQDGAIHFHADKNISTDINGCAVSSFTLTPFGSNRLAAEWQAGECQGGHMVLAKAPR
jgi:type IV secretory pathway VirB10-like protein